MMKLTIVLAAAVASAAPALAQSYTGGSGAFSGIGANGGYPASGYDFATFTGLSGVFTGPGTYAFDTVDFSTGINATTVHSDSGSFPLTALIGGSSVPYAVNYTVDIGSAVDTLTLGGNTVQLGGYLVAFNTLSLTTGTTTSGTLTANVTAVPEPASWVLMLAGFGAIGSAARYGRRRTDLGYA